MVHQSDSYDRKNAGADADNPGQPRARRVLGLLPAIELQRIQCVPRIQVPNPVLPQRLKVGLSDISGEERVTARGRDGTSRFARGTDISSGRARLSLFHDRSG